MIAIDKDMNRLKIARHNAAQYGVADRIEWICGDYVEFVESYTNRLQREKAGRSEAGTGGGKQGDSAIDVVFLSPPWGELISMLQ